MKKILVFTATYNEKNNIQKVIKKIKKYAIRANILIIDDNSPDGTATVIKKIIKKEEKKKLS